MTNPVEMAHFRSYRDSGFSPPVSSEYTHTHIYIYIYIYTHTGHRHIEIQRCFHRYWFAVYVHTHKYLYIYIYTCMPILFGTVYLMMDIYVLLCVTKERYGYISIYLNLFGGFPSFSEA